MTRKHEPIALPYKITEFNEDMLLALDRNFSEIARLLSQLQVYENLAGVPVNVEVGAKAPSWDAKEDGITKSATPPVDPSLYDLWIDTSVDPPVWKQWNGHEWKKITRTLFADLEGLVQELQIANEAITEAKLAVNAVTETRIADGTITSPKILAGAVIADKIATNAVTADKIFAGAITADKIAANTIQTNHISTAGLDAGIITAGVLSAALVFAGELRAAIGTFTGVVSTRSDDGNSATFIEKDMIRSSYLVRGDYGELASGSLYFKYTGGPPPAMSPLSESFLSAEAFQIHRIGFGTNSIRWDRLDITHFDGGYGRIVMITNELNESVRLSISTNKNLSLSSSTLSISEGGKDRKKAWDAVTTMSASDVLIYADNPVASTTSSTMVMIKQAVTYARNIFRISFELALSGSGTVEARIFRNGIAVGILRSTTDTTYTLFTQDISGWEVGDLLQVYARVASGAATALVRNLRVSGSPILFEEPAWG